MLWRWLLHGLGGLIGMMLAASEDGPAISGPEREQLAKYAEQLRDLSERLKGGSEPEPGAGSCSR